MPVDRMQYQLVIYLLFFSDYIKPMNQYDQTTETEAKRVASRLGSQAIEIFAAGRNSPKDSLIIMAKALELP